MTPVERTKSFITASQPLPGRDLRAFLFITGIAIIYALTVSGECKTYIFSTSSVVLFHCKCLGFYLVFLTYPLLNF